MKTELSLRQMLIEAHLDYTNDYLTVEKFAEHNLMTKEQALQVISIGRELHEINVEVYKHSVAGRN